MSSTITMSGSLAVRLNHSFVNPVTVAAGVTISTASNGIIGQGPTDWTLVNFGTVGGAKSGITLANGGYLSNAGGAIHGGQYGIAISSGGGTVSNDGTVGAASSMQYTTSSGKLYVTGSIGTALYLADGGSVVNGASSTTAAVVGTLYGIHISGSVGLVTNNGTITAEGSFTSTPVGTNQTTYGTRGVGVALESGGDVRNGSISAATAAIVGGLTGVSLSDSGSISNYGTISGDTRWIYLNPYFYEDEGVGVSLAGGGFVKNGSLSDDSASIRGGVVGVSVSGGAGTVDNFGNIVGLGASRFNEIYHFGTGVALQSGGSLVNGNGSVADGASIGGSDAGVVVDNAYGKISNFGKIVGAGYDRYYNKYYHGTGVALSAGGHLLNGSTAVMSAQIVGGLRGVYAGGAFSTIGNDGTIVGVYGGATGILLAAGGRLNNGVFGVATALISASGTGVVINGGPATLINQGNIIGGVGVLIGTGVTTATLTNTGTITGSAGTAVSFASGTDIVAIGTGAVFNGNVVGYASASNTIQLQNGGAGSLSGLGSQFQGFTTVSVLAGASWNLVGANLLAAGAGVQLAAGSTLAITGSLNVAAQLSLSGTGQLDIGAAGRLAVGDGTGLAGFVAIEPFKGGSMQAGTIVGAGTIAAAVSDFGVLDAAGGTLGVTGQLVGQGIAEISGAAVLSLGGASRVAQIEFLAGTNDTLALGSPAEVNSLISGLGSSDEIDLLGTVATAISFSATTHVLRVKASSTTIAALHFTSAYTGHSFGFGSDGHGGTNIYIH